jgi:hypothetical protein
MIAIRRRSEGFVSARVIPSTGKLRKAVIDLTDKVGEVLAGLVLYAVLSMFGVGVSAVRAQTLPAGCTAPANATRSDCQFRSEAYDACMSQKAASDGPSPFCSLGNSYDHYQCWRNGEFSGGPCFFTGASGFFWGSPECPAGKAWNEVRSSCISFDPDKNAASEMCPVLGKPRLQCGNPINVAIGNKYQVASDFSLTSLLAFTRYYNSIVIGRSDLLGPQWSHIYARNVAYLNSGSANLFAVVSRAEGNRVTFKLASGVWTADADVIATLVRRDNAQGALLGWTYTPQDGREVEQYDALGRLLQITKSDGSAINLTYNNGVIENNANDLRLTQVQAQDGRSLVFTYDTSNRIHQITDPSGGLYLYGYDTSGRLSTVTYPGGTQHTYLYNEPAFTGGASLPNALTGIVHEDGQRFATFNYQADGRAISTEHAGAVDKFAVQYNADGTSTVTTPLGTTQQRTFSTVLGVKKAMGIVETCPDCSP